jgi:putative two-component system response regulator
VVSIALNGKQALQRAMVDPQPDIILLDVLMPDMDGYEVCRRFKAESKTKDIPIIFITAMSEEEDEAKGLQAGAVDYLTKPLKETIVMARIKLQLELRRAMKQLSDKNSFLEKQLNNPRL